jgi:hypothetical protein
VVQDICNHPRPIGLLFAGNDVGLVFANPIQDVLDALQVKMVGVKKEKKKCDLRVKGRKRVLAEHLDQAREVKQRQAELLWQLPGVVGHAIGVSSADPTALAIVIMVQSKSDEILQQLPTQLDGMPVEILEVGTIKAFKQ